MNQSNDEPEEGLKRKLGLTDVFAICAGGMMSSGFFVLPGIAMADTGPSLIVAYLIASLVILPAIASIAELSTSMPKAGGAYHLLERSLGRMTGTVTGIGIWAQHILKSAFALVGLGAYLTLLVDLPVQPVAVALTVVFMAINLVGVQETGLMQRLLVYTTVGVLAFFIVQGVAYLMTGTEYEALPGQFTPFAPEGLGGLFATVGTVFVAYTGLSKVASVAEEIDRPTRNIPLGMLLAWLTVSAIYLAGTFVIVGVLDAEVLAGDTTPVATAASAFMDWLPFNLGFLIIVLAALAAFASTANAALMAASRYGFAMGRDNTMPERLAQINRMGTPSYSIVATAGIMIVAIIFLDVEQLAKLASAFQLLIFVLLCLAVVIMRQARPELSRKAYRSPLYPVTQIVGVLVYPCLIVFMGGLAMLMTIALLTLGIAWYWIYARKAEREQTALDDLLQRWRAQRSR